MKGFGSQLTTSAVGVGDVYLRSICQGATKNLKLSNVLHVPTSRLNLVSQGCLERREISCKTSNGNITLFTQDGTSIIEGSLTDDNLYQLRLEPIARPNADPISACQGEPIISAATGKSQDFYTAY